MRRQLAISIGCQLAYISLVLGGNRDFSIEQAEACTRFLGLGKDETEYFIWLVERERAGTQGSRNFFDQLLEQKRAQYLQFKKRVAISHELDDVDKAIYYSDYLYAAIHMAITVPSLRTPQAISRRLGESLERVIEILDFLKTRQLIREEKGALLPTSQHIFIDRSSPFVGQHHRNWRMQAIRSASRRDPKNLHLSLAVTMSERDAALLRNRIAEFIEEISTVIKASPEEKLMSFGVDFFEP
jgi:uncharacterized protein (TIGR02147 family)